MKIIYIYVQSMKLNTETCLHLYSFFFVLFFFFAAKSYWFLFKSSISWHFLILAFLGAVIRLNFISCPNWWIVILLYSSSIKLFSGTSVSLWFAGSSLKHALICFFLCFSDAIFPVNCISFVVCPSLSIAELYGLLPVFQKKKKILSSTFKRNAT